MYDYTYSSGLDVVVFVIESLWHHGNGSRLLVLEPLTHDDLDVLRGRRMCSMWSKVYA